MSTRPAICAIARGTEPSRPEANLILGAPAAYQPLRAGWAYVPGHSGGLQSKQTPERPNLQKRRAQSEKDQTNDHASEVRQGPRRHL